MCGGRSPEHARRSFVGVDGPGPQAIGVSPLDGSGPQAVGVSPLVRPHLRPEGPTVNSRRCEPPERAPRREASPQRGRQSVCLRRALPPLTGARVSGDAGFRRLTPPATDYRPFRAWYCTATRPFHRGTGILPCVAGPSWPCKAWFVQGLFRPWDAWAGGPCHDAALRYQVGGRPTPKRSSLSVIGARRRPTCSHPRCQYRKRTNPRPITSRVQHCLKW